MIARTARYGQMICESRPSRRVASARSTPVRRRGLLRGRATPDREARAQRERGGMTSDEEERTQHERGDGTIVVLAAHAPWRCHVDERRVGEMLA